MLGILVFALFVCLGFMVAGQRIPFADDAPREIDGLRVTQIEFGVDYSAAIMEDGALWMWEDDTSEKLGDGTAELRLDPVKIIEDVASVSLGELSRGLTRVTLGLF